ncbi:MAG: nickel-dependent hydrogenase large subunit [Thermoanaerobacterales bacterium]|nr:nickel-dependent hydrogenase large subunit [Thermoanaerobacterales bacterium]
MKIVISPMTRSIGPGQLEVTVEGGQVVDARCCGTFFRGFELIMRGRDPRDAPYLTQRICGICCASHAVAAAEALDDLAGIQPTPDGQLVRNLLLGVVTLQNQIRHFYFLGLPDWVQGPDMHPFKPQYTKDLRLPRALNSRLVEHYFGAGDVTRVINEMEVILGGKVPHQHGIIGGGATVIPRPDIILDLRSKLQRVNRFISEKYLPDAHALAEHYSDYFEIGRRPENMMTYGMFPRTPGARDYRFPGAALIEGRIEEVDVREISESVRHSFFSDQPENGWKALSDTKPDPGRKGAYSWVKAPRYRGRAVETGPLVRLWVSGRYRRGVSTMDRILARAIEAEIIGGLMQEWLEQLEPGQPVYRRYELPEEGEGLGISGVPRGGLLHRVRVRGGRIDRYQVITPSAWHFSPRDGEGRPGPIEEALLGTPVANPKQPVEIGRVVRAFDPCMACATHLLTPGGNVQRFII